MVPDDLKHETEAANPSARNSGLFANLKHILFGENPAAQKPVSQELKGEAEAVIDSIQQMLDTNKLDDNTTQKLSAIIMKLKSALDKGTLARGSLATALSEAKAAVSTGSDKSLTEKQKTDQLWHRVEADNNAINDDFDKMQKAGIHFSDGLLKRQKELLEYMQTHPHDLAKQKELDALGDVMIDQAKSQLKQHPEAQADFDDAQKKSNDRHKLVDRDLAVGEKRNVLKNSALNDDAFTQNNPSPTLTMNDVTPPLLGQRPQSSSKGL